MGLQSKDQITKHMSKMIIRVHPCEDKPEMYNSITEAAEAAGVSYQKMYNAMRKQGEYIAYPYKYIQK